jgi:hypothetical protein
MYFTEADCHGAAFNSQMPAVAGIVEQHFDPESPNPSGMGLFRVTTDATRETRTFMSTYQNIGSSRIRVGHFSRFSA